VNDDLDEARRLFADNGLPFPEWIADLGAPVVRRSEWRFTTSEGPPASMVDEHVIAYLEDPDPQVAIVLAHDGRGTTGWALHLFVTTPSVGAFVQCSWGDAHDSPDDDAVRVMHMAERFAAAGDVVAARTRVPAGQRLVVVDADIAGRRWAQVGDTLDWQHDDRPLEAALAAITS
jgi:hypothetical protein